MRERDVLCCVESSVAWRSVDSSVVMRRQREGVGEREG